MRLGATVSMTARLAPSTGSTRRFRRAHASPTSCAATRWWPESMRSRRRERVAQPWVPLRLEWEIEPRLRTASTAGRSGGSILPLLTERPSDDPTLSGALPSDRHRADARGRNRRVAHGRGTARSRPHRRGGRLDRAARDRSRTRSTTSTSWPLPSTVWATDCSDYRWMNSAWCGSAPRAAQTKPVRGTAARGGGALRVTRARLVDAFGRTLELPVTATARPGA